MSDLLNWLAGSLSGATEHSIPPWASWHARCMVLGWGVLLPVGALLARYFKITARQQWPQELDNKAWWHAHRLFQWLGVMVVSLGVAIAWGHSQNDSTAAVTHVWAGWVLVALGWGQIAAGLARGSKGGPAGQQLRGDHYDMTPRRVVFERLHKFLGWLTLLAAVTVIVLGLFLADAPRWMLLVLGLWWLALAAAAWQWQKQGRCVDTYQAIWGPDARHPGNARRPIGWGVRRPSTWRHHG